MRTLIVALVVGLLVVAGAPRANAITAGTADGSGHPEVGLMAAFDADGGYLWRCSGTLISDRVFLTAGHCTQSPAARVDLWFTPTVGGLSDVHGTPRTYPSFDPATPSTDDVGVVVLDRPMPLTTYGRLPAAGQLDTLHPGRAPRSPPSATAFRRPTRTPRPGRTSRRWSGWLPIPIWSRSTRDCRTSPTGRCSSRPTPPAGDLLR
ncbi:trypsin-like serine protease [Raineyella fluvialis]|uniref:trypsin-like serine protease n=1 Tax=Raineyella fluvialis TaxID=2662261 RepID=UPI001E4B2262|nr:trypsin-like serine protease [Raineyella fluvialis]